MADLWMARGRLRWEVLSIAPVTKGGHGDAVQYAVRTRADPGSEASSYVFSIEGWTMGPFELYAVASAFAGVRGLVATRLPGGILSASGSRPLSLWEGAGWLCVTLWAHVPRARPSAIVGQIFVQDGSDIDVYRRTFARVTLEEAERFGQEFAREIVAASPEWARENGLA